MTVPNPARLRPAAVIAAATTLTAAALACLGLAAPAAADPLLLRTASVTLFAIGLYTTGVLPGHMATLSFFLAAMLLAVAPAAVVFSGFHSTALWLVFGGLLLGIAVDRSGLGARVARTLASAMNGSYVRIIASLVLMTTALAFLLPSSLGRIALLIPIVLSIADELGYGPGRRGRTGMVLAAGLGCFLPPFSILPANIANLVMLGTAESLYGIQTGYGRYLLLHFPITGLAKALVIIAVVCLLFPDRRPDRRAAGRRTRMSAAERRLAVILAAAVALWATDFWHGISPAWIGLGAGLVCLLPWSRMIPLKSFQDEVNHSAFFFVAGIVSVGAVAAHGGLGAWIGSNLIEATGLAPGRPFLNYLAVAAAGIVVGLGTTLPGIPAVMTPLADLFSVATGFTPEIVIMIQVISFSMVLLPYQAPPLMLAIHLGGIRAADMARCTLAIALITAVLLVPLNYAWWRLLGVLP